MDHDKTAGLTRRNFLWAGTRSLANLAAANVGIYVIGSVFKQFDGSMVAGAKCVIGTCICMDLSSPGAANYLVCDTKCAVHGGVMGFCQIGDEW